MLKYLHQYQPVTSELDHAMFRSVGEHQYVWHYLDNSAMDTGVNVNHVCCCRRGTKIKPCLVTKRLDN
jgi:hypothetical protein